VLVAGSLSLFFTPFFSHSELSLQTSLVHFLSRHALVLSAPDLSIFTTKLYILTITLNNIEMRNSLFIFN
jgi:hypothetical protein